MMQRIALLILILLNASCTSSVLPFKHKKGDKYISVLPLYVVDSRKLACPFYVRITQEHFDESVRSSIPITKEHNKDIELVPLPKIFENSGKKIDLLPVGSVFELVEYRYWRKSGWNTGGYDGISILFKLQSHNNGELVIDASEFNPQHPGIFMDCINSIEKTTAFKKIQ